MMTALPPDFVRLMHEHYEARVADTLCQALQTTEPETSVRLNRRKVDVSLPLEPVPWCPDAYYLTERPAFTFDPLLHAGAYYVQEASSMYLARLLAHCPQFAVSGARLSVLDLCAAPGGKSTLLAGLLPEGSLLVSNEPVAKRAQILSENMQKWTRMSEGHYPVHNVVTQNFPDDFAGLTACFDILVTDVPCSGEGMFRKDEGAVRDWSLAAVERCCLRQRDILRSIWHTLRPGGLLVYSTCTFNRYEDEDNATWVCTELGGELLEERHFLPGIDRGEGFYCAAIRKTLPCDVVAVDGDEASPLIVASAKEDSPAPSPDDVLRKVQRTLRLMPETFSVDKESPRVELTYDEALQYLRHEAVRVASPRGLVFLTYGGLILGPGKGVGGRVNNLYPSEWRIRSGYTTPFSLLPPSL